MHKILLVLQLTILLQVNYLLIGDYRQNMNLICFIYKKLQELLVDLLISTIGVQQSSAKPLSGARISTLATRRTTP
jgi:hypothetical protein